MNLTVYCTVSFTCKIYFLNSTYFILVNLRVTNVRVSFAVEYIRYMYKLNERLFDIVSERRVRWVSIIADLAITELN